MQRHSANLSFCQMTFHQDFNKSIILSLIQKMSHPISRIGVSVNKFSLKILIQVYVVDGLTKWQLTRWQVDQITLANVIKLFTAIIYKFL